MSFIESYRLHHEDSGELLGIVARDSTGWLTQTVFGYTIARTDDQTSAEKLLASEGARYLQGVWQYLDPDEREWFPCVIIKAHETQVVVNRTNELGFQEPASFKQVVLENPSETNLIKSQ
jgi:hypothetical protein